MDELFPQELRRIRWRQRMLAHPYGRKWLLHCARLYNFREQLLCPTHIGLPNDLRRAMWHH